MKLFRRYRGLKRISHNGPDLANVATCTTVSKIEIPGGTSYDNGRERELYRFKDYIDEQNLTKTLDSPIRFVTLSQLNR